MDQTINFGMNNFQNTNNNMNQINNANGFNNPMLNQYDQINPMLNQMNTFNQNNPMLNQKANYNQGNPIYNQMNVMLNQMNIILSQMNSMLNQMNSYEKNNPMIIMDINFMNQNMNEINEKMNEMNEKMKQINEINLKQINEINQEKIKKEKIQNIKLKNLNINLMELLNSIIQFYKENNNDYMNFDNPYQIKNMIYFLSLNYYKLDISDNIEDPLYYIEEPKKMIKFINSDYKEYKVNIPLSITKYDLYSIAQNYKCFKNNKNNATGNHSNILLINNNLILKRDETSIDCINENDIIIIIEPRNFPDDSFYKSLQERTEKKRHIKFEFSSGKKIARIFPDDIKIYEIYKSINLEFGFDINTYQLLFSGLPLEKKDEQEGSFLFGFVITIYEYNIFSRKFLFGKVVEAKIKYNKKINQSESIGILNSIKDLKQLILTSLGKNKIKILKIENKAIEEGDIRSLFSLGIKNDFTCFVEYEE